MKIRFRAVAGAVLVATTGIAVGLMPVPALAAEDPASATAKAQAAFFALDAAVLSQLAAATAPWAKSANAREQYAHAYVQFRVQQVATLQKREKDAQKAGTACVDTLDAALQREPKSAEALALQSSCYGYLAGLGGLGAIRNGSRSGKAVEAALVLEPKNPRVILVDGFGVYQRPKFVGGDKAKGCVKFREAAAAFDAAGTGASTNGIGWGAPEAHYWAGRCATDAGNVAAARPEYERALALAPDFAAAKKALGR